MNKEYKKFLEGKEIVDYDSGFKIRQDKLNPMLFDFQKAITQWSLKRGRSAIFADCGLGKTPMQLAWANQVHKKTKLPILIIAPLAVSKQTKREGEKFNIDVTICRSQTEIIDGINITNYEMLQHFEADQFGGLVIDESSILKGYDGKFRKAINEFGSVIPYRLACTATPAPNDIMEIINHAEFLGIMSAKEILSLFFIQDGNTTHKWRLKNHAKDDFWKWLASWSVALRMPSDLGFDNDGFVLPKLKIHQITVKSSKLDKLPGRLFALEAKGLQDRQRARRNSQTDRVSETAELINGSDEQWLIWCDLNSESDSLKHSISGSVEIKGADSSIHKEKSLLGFQDGSVNKLVTKPSIAGFGLNLQNCHNMAFVGLSDSYEKYYQAVRRCWRFGQEQEVNVYIIASETEGSVVKNIKRKERESSEMMDHLIENMNLSGQLQTKREEMVYMEDKKTGKDWELHLGDSVETMKHIEDESIGLSVFSPPFPGMYVYTNSKHDVGNTKNIEELIEQLRFIVDKDHLLRITQPGRHCCMHLTQAVAFKNMDGFIGIKDFRGKVIEMMQDEGWIYYGEVCIDKDPQVKAIRTKDRGLLFKTLAKDASHLHMGLADYLLQFRKPGDSPEPIHAGISEKYDVNGWITSEEWIEWAAPVWYRKTKDYPGGIKETDVLNYRQAKDIKDEKHLCPLQLGVIERAVKLWSNPGDTIYSPFTGIGSEGFVALQLERAFKGCELKQSYFNSAVKNLKSVTKRNKGFNLYQNR